MGNSLNEFSLERHDFTQPRDLLKRDQVIHPNAFDSKLQPISFQHERLTDLQVDYLFGKTYVILSLRLGSSHTLIRERNAFRTVHQRFEDALTFFQFIEENDRFLEFKSPSFFRVVPINGFSIPTSEATESRCDHSQRCDKK